MMEENGIKTKYYLIKIVTTTEGGYDGEFAEIKHHREFDGTADTIEEAEHWAEQVYVPTGSNVPSVTPYAIKGEEVYFEMKQKTMLVAKAAAGETTNTAHLIKLAEESEKEAKGNKK
ncbi:MAG: hypothetical protein WC788_07670 [Candidatus Paceibacterota bacterium]|jgi:hypothetical protein